MPSFTFENMVSWLRIKEGGEERLRRPAHEDCFKIWPGKEALALWWTTPEKDPPVSVRQYYFETLNKCEGGKLFIYCWTCLTTAELFVLTFD